MSLTKDDIKQIGQIVVEVTSPMFEQMGERFDRVETELHDFKREMTDFKHEMTDFKSEMTDFKHEMTDFKSEIRTKLATLEAKIDRIATSHTDRFENVEDDVHMLYTLVRKLEHGNKEEKLFAEKTIVQHLPAIHKAIMIIAKKNNISLS